jgi:hypothetical protein
MLRRMWAIRVATLLILLLARASPGESQSPPAALVKAEKTQPGPVEAEMRNVLYHVDDRVVLRIAHLRGALLPTARDAPPWFDDPRSFSLAIDSGEVAIDPASLTALLNRYVFNYDGSPITGLKVTVEKGRLKQTGTLHKGVSLPFTIRADLSATADGRLRLHPTSVKVAGISVKGLMHAFGLEMENLVKLRPGAGVEVRKDDFLLAPTGMLPPPTIKGLVTAVRLDGDEIVQVLGGSEREGWRERLHPSDPKAANFMFYRGKVLRFGKLTMVDADLQIVDADPKDPFDFCLSHLNEQLVAGESHNQPDFGLVTILPDYSDLHRKVASAGGSR